MIWWKRERKDDELQRRVHDLERDVTVLRERLAEAAAKAATVQPPVDMSLVTRLLESNERLSLRFEALWERDRERARVQRINARRVRSDKDAERQAVEVVSKEVEPPEFVGQCEECLASLEQRSPEHNRDMLKHSQHKAEFWGWLDGRAGSAATTSNHHS